MLLVSLRTLPAGAWAVIFGGMTAWFGRRVYRESRGRPARVLAGGHHVPHLVHSAAMLYMFAATASPAAGARFAMVGTAGSGQQMLRVPVVALVFALVLAGYAVLDLDRLSGTAGRGGVRARQALAPGSAVMAGDAAAAASARGGQADVAWPRVLPAGAGGAAPASALLARGPVLARDRVLARGSRAEYVGGGEAGSRSLLAPRLAAGCRIAMGVTMAFMLIMMI
jgi:hypothetical protein